jgi:PAS domain S-box-containing protein
MRLLLALSDRWIVTLTALLRRHLPATTITPASTMESFLECVATDVFDTAIIELGFGEDQADTVWDLLNGTSCILLVPVMRANEIGQIDSFPADDFLVHHNDAQDVALELVSRIRLGHRRQLSYQVLRRRYEDITQSLSEIIYRLDREGKFIYLNRAIELLGYTPDELLGRHFSEILDPDTLYRISRDRVLPGLKGTATGAESAPRLFDERRRGRRRTANLEVVLQPRDTGTAAAVLGSVTATGEVVRGADGSQEFVGTVGVIQDVTLSRRSADTLRKLYAIAEEAPVSVIVTDRNLVVEYANPRFYRTFEGAPEEAIGHPVTDLPPIGGNDSLVQSVKRAGENGGTWKATLLGVSDDRAITPQSVVVRPVVDGRGDNDGIVMVIADLTSAHSAADLTTDEVLRDQLPPVELGAIIKDAVRHARSDFGDEITIALPDSTDSLDPVQPDLAVFMRLLIRDLFGFALASAGCLSCSLAVARGSADQIELIVRAEQQQRPDDKADSPADRFRLSALIDRSDRMQRMVRASGGGWELRRSKQAVEFLVSIPPSMRIDLDELTGRKEPASGNTVQFDLHELHEAYFGMEDLLKEIVRIYSEETPEKLLAMRAAINDGDLESVMRIAYSISDTSGALHAHRAVELGRELGKAAREYDSESVYRISADLLPEVEAILRVISRINP